MKKGECKQIFEIHEGGLAQLFLVVVGLDGMEGTIKRN